MMTKMDKMTGRGEMKGQTNTTKQSERGSVSPRRQKGLQGRGGRGGRGLRTPPHTMLCSTRLSDLAMKSQEQMIVEEEDQVTNPFLILQMDEEEELEDEEMEKKVVEMQVVSPGRSPRRSAAKRMEREDASVGSMR